MKARLLRKYNHILDWIGQESLDYHEPKIHQKTEAHVNDIRGDCSLRDTVKCKAWD